MQAVKLVSNPCPAWVPTLKVNLQQAGQRMHGRRPWKLIQSGPVWVPTRLVRVAKTSDFKPGNFRKT